MGHKLPLEEGHKEKGGREGGNPSLIYGREGKNNTSQGQKRKRRPGVAEAGKEGQGRPGSKEKIGERKKIKLHRDLQEFGKTGTPAPGRGAVGGPDRGGIGNLR